MRTAFLFAAGFSLMFDMRGLAGFFLVIAAVSS